MASPPHRASDVPLPMTGDGPQANGHDGGGDGTAAHVPTRPPGPSAKPALVLFAVVFAVFLTGFLADLLSGSPSSPPPRPSAATAVPGTGGLVPEPAGEVLGAVVTAGEPPADVLAALVVPAGTRYVPGSGVQRGLGLFDATVALELPTPEQEAITFFRAELAAGRWHVLSAGATSGGGYRLIAQHPGSDGYEWEVGETLSPTAFRSGVPGVTVPATGVTPVALRLFSVSDQ